MIHGLRKYGKENLGDVLVLGLGKSGKSTARYLVGLLGSRVNSVFIAAGAFNEDSRKFVRSLARDGVGYAFGDEALVGLQGRFDLCIASPGIPFWHDLYQGGLRISNELVSEVEFAWRESAPDSTWVAITGTNGKTTTTALTAHILRECGFKAQAVGNIGDVCLDAVAAGQTDVYVAEVSSYQLESTRLFAPDVAVLLNITPDHIHWHKTLESYRDAKFKILRAVLGGAQHMPSYCDEEMKPRTKKGFQPIAVLDATNDVVRAKVRECKAQGASYIPLGTAEGIQADMRERCGAPNAAFIAEDGVLTVALSEVEHELGSVRELQIQGAHNASNALAAGAVAVALGAADEAIAQALAGFAPLEHRIEPCGVVDGVECYNDSKATNVDATCKALEAFPGKRVVVMLGGDDKGTDLGQLVASVHAHAASAVCFGAGGPRFAEALESREANAPVGFVCARAEHLKDALDAALALAGSGDVVLLSPACASFDEFTSFEQRGHVFKKLVSERAARQAPIA